MSFLRQIRAIRIRTVDILGHADQKYMRNILELLNEPNMPLSLHWALPSTALPLKLG